MKFVLTAILAVLLVGCSGAQVVVTDSKIWDIYSDINYDNEESFINNLQKKHPQEYRMLSWLKSDGNRAYVDFMDLMKSRTFEDGAQVKLTPNCYWIEGEKTPILQADLLKLFEKNKIEPMPDSSPHGAVAGFIDSLAGGTIGQAQLAVSGEFSSNLKTHDDQIAYWNGISKGNLFARCVVRRVDMPKDLKSAVVSLELLFFTEQKTSYDVIELVRVKKTYNIKLSEVGTWLVTKES
jgi:hypothetical protein